MTPSDRPRLAKMLAVLGEAFNERVSDIRAEAYYDALRDLPIERIVEAGRIALRTNKFFPRPVELRELVTGQPDDVAEVAWMAVLREVRRVGYLGTPTLPEAALETVRSLWGSWGHLCSTLPGDGPELIGWAKQFKAAHVATERHAQAQLPGRDEAKSLLASVTKRIAERSES